MKLLPVDQFATLFAETIRASRSRHGQKVAVKCPVRDLASQSCTFDIGLPIMDAAPYTGVDDLLYEVMRMFIVARGLHDVCAMLVRSNSIR